MLCAGAVIAQLKNKQFSTKTLCIERGYAPITRSSVLTMIAPQ
jgi:hypothetical protein